MVRVNDYDSQYGNINRRAFLKLSGLLGLGVASAGIIPASAEAVKFGKKMYKVSRTELALGTFVSMTLIHPSRDEAEELIGQAFGEIARLSGLLSRFDTLAPVAQLNNEGYLKEVPPELAQVLSRAFFYHKLSHGAFDITVKPVVDLFQEKLGGQNKVAPTDAEIAKVLEFVGSHQIELGTGAIRFKRSKMGITLDGIAKGFIVDKASIFLSERAVKNHLINAGGDIRTMGSKSSNRPWTIAIEDPAKKNPAKKTKYPDMVHMRDGAIATSGNYEIYFDREKMFHHIVDPMSGRSPVLNTSVSVMTNTTMDADALSTSVFVMDPIQGMKLIDALPTCEGLVIAKDGSQRKSKGWKSAAI